jgi:hypothetical protein
MFEDMFLYASNDFEVSFKLLFNLWQLFYSICYEMLSFILRRLQIV